MTDVRAALQRKLGPLAVWVWALLAGVGIYFYRNRGSSGTSSLVDNTGANIDASTPSPQDPVTLDPGESVYDPNTGALISGQPDTSNEEPTEPVTNPSPTAPKAPPKKPKPPHGKHTPKPKPHHHPANKSPHPVRGKSKHRSSGVVKSPRPHTVKPTKGKAKGRPRFGVGGIAIRPGQQNDHPGARIRRFNDPKPVMKQRAQATHPAPKSPTHATPAHPAPRPASRKAAPHKPAPRRRHK